VQVKSEHRDPTPCCIALLIYSRVEAGLERRRDALSEEGSAPSAGVQPRGSCTPHCETAAAMVAQLKYGAGAPFYRLEQLEAQLGIPCMPHPAISSQRTCANWQVMARRCGSVVPAHRIAGASGIRIPNGSFEGIGQPKAEGRDRLFEMPGKIRQGRWGYA
jgi:hypothetical protein